MFWMLLGCLSVEKDQRGSVEGTDTGQPNEVTCNEEERILLYVDADFDGFGAEGTASLECPGNIGWSDNEMDCDDTNASVYPSATEECDDLDNDCDGQIDNRVSGATDPLWGTLYYKDADMDGYGDDNQTLQSCAQPDGFVIDGGDCDDSNALVYPFQQEECDGVDNDCDGEVDNRVGAITDPLWGTLYYADSDGDGFGNVNQTLQACTVTTGVSEVSGDCDDSNSLVYPQASEGCDGIDSNCDGAIGSAEMDIDGDGFVSCTSSGTFSDTWLGDSSVLGGDDCNDTDPYSFPGAAAQDSTTDCLRDADLDGYGDISNGGTDCDDADAGVYPGATELAMDGVDQNCDGYELCPLDADGDGFIGTSGQTLSTEIECGMNGTLDCNDSDATIHPGAPETDGASDLNCDGLESVDSTCESANVGSVYYLFCEDAVTWETARDRCDAAGYDFASIQSSTENMFVATTVSTATWLGFRDEDGGSTSCGPQMNFQWVHGQAGYYQVVYWAMCFGSPTVNASGYQNWGPNEPDNGSSGTDCVSVDSFGVWSDGNCALNKPYICETR